MDSANRMITNPEKFHLMFLSANKKGSDKSTNFLKYQRYFFKIVVIIVVS